MTSAWRLTLPCSASGEPGPTWLTTASLGADLGLGWCHAHRLRASRALLCTHAQDMQHGRAGEGWGGKGEELKEPLWQNQILPAPEVLAKIFGWGEAAQDCTLSLNLGLAEPGKACGQELEDLKNVFDPDTAWSIFPWQIQVHLTQLPHPTVCPPISAAKSRALLPVSSSSQPSPCYILYLCSWG